MKNRQKEDFDEKTSVLPKWFLEKGLMDTYGFLESKQDIRDGIELLKNPANMKNRTNKPSLFMLKRAKKQLKEFRIEYFSAADVEMLFRDRLMKGKYHVINVKCHTCGKHFEVPKDKEYPGKNSKFFCSEKCLNKHLG